jgi:hypothetical protein
MQITTVGNNYAITIGWLIAVLVLLIAILGLLSVIPFTPTVMFGLVAALAVARLL